MTTIQILLGYLACGLVFFLSQMPMVWRMYRESMAAVDAAVDSSLNQTRRSGIRKILAVGLIPGFFIALFLWPITVVAKILGSIFGWKEPEGPDAIEILQGEN